MILSQMTEVGPVHALAMSLVVYWDATAGLVHACFALLPEISDQASITVAPLQRVATQHISLPFLLIGICWHALREADVLCLLRYFVTHHSQDEEPLFCLS